METENKKITLQWVFQTFDFFISTFFSLLILGLIIFILSFFGIDAPRNYNINKPKNKENVSKNQEPQKRTLEIVIYEYSD